MPTIFCSENTMKMNREDIDKVINATTTFLPKPLIYAIIRQESNFGQFTARYEPGLLNQGWYTRILTPQEKTDRYSYCSLGAMQILFGIAKTHGYQGPVFGLINNETNITYGVKHLEALWKQYGGVLTDVIASYNGGGWAVNEKRKTGKYPNQDGYVTPVLKYYQDFGGKP